MTSVTSFSLHIAKDTVVRLPYLVSVLTSFSEHLLVTYRSFSSRTSVLHFTPLTMKFCWRDSLCDEVGISGAAHQWGFFIPHWQNLLVGALSPVSHKILHQGCLTDRMNDRMTSISQYIRHLLKINLWNVEFLKAVCWVLSSSLFTSLSLEESGRGMMFAGSFLLTILHCIHSPPKQCISPYYCSHSDVETEKQEWQQINLSLMLKNISSAAPKPVNVRSL